MANLKLKFGFDTDNLTAYVDQTNLELFTKAVFSNATSQYLSGQVQSGIKYKEQINYMDVDVTLRAKEGCGLTSSGDVIFDKKEIQVYPFYDQKTFCPSDLETFYTQQYLPQGSTYENMPIEQAFAEYYSAKVAAAVEVLLWQGATGGASGVIGFNQIIDNDSDVIDGNAGTGWTPIVSGTGILTTNVISIFNNMVNQLPDALAGQTDLEFVCGWDTFRKLLQAYFTLNNFHYGATEEGSPYATGSIIIPSFGLRVTALHGLTGTNRIHLAQKSNYVIGTDAPNEYESLDVFYERKDNTIIARLIAKLGTQIRFGSELVTFKLA
jgi:hypothetical protein